jgi:hypothetical protein
MCGGDVALMGGEAIWGVDDSASGEWTRVGRVLRLNLKRRGEGDCSI